jgi:hypothetical protein
MRLLIQFFNKNKDLKMKRLFIAATTAYCVLLSGMSTAFAQGGPPQFNAIELWACNYRAGKDAEDFDDALEGVAEASSGTDYSSWVLNPYLVGPNMPFDVIYLGAWPSGAAMGSGMAAYLANGGDDADEAWNEAVDCPASTLFAGYEIEPLPESGDDDGDGTFLLSVADCKVGHGVSNGQALAALERFNSYAVANGSTVPTFAWFPVFGPGEAEYSFKLAQAFGGPEDLGNTFQWSVDNAAYNVNDELTGGIVDCDIPRLYTGRTVTTDM